MGNCFGGTFTRVCVEEFLDILQDDALSQFKGDNFFQIDSWNSKTVYGYDFNRNQSFHAMLDYLSPLYRQGFKQANQSVGQLTGNQEEFINKQLAHHVMKMLLNGNNPVSINFDELVKGMIGYKLPGYSKDAMEQFRKEWTTLPTGQLLSLKTTDKAEKELLSAILAARVSTVIHAIDIPSFVAQALAKFNSLQQAEALKHASLFAQTGSSAQALADSRREYTAEEQERDLRKVIKEDLRKTSPSDMQRGAAAFKRG